MRGRMAQWLNGEGDVSIARPDANKIKGIRADMLSRFSRKPPRSQLTGAVAHCQSFKHEQNEICAQNSPGYSALCVVRRTLDRAKTLTFKHAMNNKHEFEFSGAGVGWIVEATLLVGLSYKSTNKPRLGLGKGKQHHGPLCLCIRVVAIAVFRNMRFSPLLGLATLLLPSLSSGLPSAQLDERQAGSSWFLPHLDHTSGPVRAYVPNLVNGAGQPNYTYPVYKAVNSGDSQGLINAIYSDGPSGGQRDNCWLAGQPRVIYLAPGKESPEGLVAVV